jgi:hypothetical protein
MWFGMGHLLLGNWIIGDFEAWVVEKVKKVDLHHKKIILGNYISMLVGMFFIAPFFVNLVRHNDFWGGTVSQGEYDILGFFIGMGCAFIVSLIVEYPFFKWAIIEKMEKRQALNITVFANSISYIFMVGIYYLINMAG